MDRDPQRAVPARAVDPAARARRIAVFRALRVGLRPKGRSGHGTQYPQPAHLLAEPVPRGDCQEPLQRLPPVPYRQLQGPVRRIAGRGGLPPQRRHGRFAAARRYPRHDALPERENERGLRGDALRGGRAVQETDRDPDLLPKQVGRSEQHADEHGRVLAGHGRGRRLLQLHAHSRRGGRQLVHGRTETGTRRHAARRADLCDRDGSGCRASSRAR